MAETVSEGSAMSEVSPVWGANRSAPGKTWPNPGLNYPRSNVPCAQAKVSILISFAVSFSKLSCSIRRFLLDIHHCSTYIAHIAHTHRHTRTHIIYVHTHLNIIYQVSSAMKTSLFSGGSAREGAVQVFKGYGMVGMVGTVRGVRWVQYGRYGGVRCAGYGGCGMGGAVRTARWGGRMGGSGGYNCRYSSRICRCSSRAQRTVPAIPPYPVYCTTVPLISYLPYNHRAPPSRTLIFDHRTLLQSIALELDNIYGHTYVYIYIYTYTHTRTHTHIFICFFF